MRSAVNLLPQEVEKLPCSAHRINLCVKDLFKVTNIIETKRKFFIFDYNDEDELRKIEINDETKIEIEETNNVKESLNLIISKCKRLVSSFSHSEALVRKFKEKQNFLKLTRKIKLIQSVPTRWNSIYDMIESIVINRDVLSSMSLEPEHFCIKKHVPTDNEFNILDDLCLLLHPLKEISIIFSGRFYNTISLLFPSIFYLINNELDEITIVNDEIEKLRETLKASLRKRFRFVFNNDLFLAATFLNYNYRKFEFINDFNERSIKLNKAKQFINKKFKIQKEGCFSFSSGQPTSTSTPLSDNSFTQNRLNLSGILSDSSQSVNSTNSTPINIRKTTKINFLKKIADKKSVSYNEAHQTELEEEIIKYENHQFNCPEDNNFDSSLNFFKMNYKLFPNLTNAARTILCIPITSVAVESFFSQSGITLNDLRSNLTPFNLKACVFYKTNKKYFF